MDYAIEFGDSLNSYSICIYTARLLFQAKLD